CLGHFMLDLLGQSLNIGTGAHGQEIGGARCMGHGALDSTPKTPTKDHTVMYMVKEIIRFSSILEIDGGGAHHIQLLGLKLVNHVYKDKTECFLVTKLGILVEVLELR
ncbi:hypothetical protein ACJX0J_039420, partial [Zea mays]